MSIKSKIVHWIVGHVPYFVFEDLDGKHYYCTLCNVQMIGGVYHRLYDESNNKRVV